MPRPIGGLRPASPSIPVSQPVTIATSSTTHRFRGSGSSFTITGTNINPATVTLSVGRQSWKVTVPANSSPERAAEAIKRQLPAALKMEIVFAADHPGGPAGIQIYQKGTKPIVAAPFVERGSTDFSRVTESWGREDSRGVVSSPPLWYTKWKMGGVAPPKTLNGVFRAGERLIIVVKNGNVDTNFSGMIKDQNGKALIVSGGEISGMQG
jgi:hypothetical protein